MHKSTLGDTLAELTQRARALGLTDTAWANLSGIRKETLSRLRHRDTCDFETLNALASALGEQLCVLPVPVRNLTSDGHFPLSVGRDYEDRLVELIISGDLDPKRWLAAGPRFFMAGLAVMLASACAFDRRKLLSLAEHLHPGVSEVAVFQQWLDRSPLRPSRFLPLVDAAAKYAA